MTCANCVNGNPLGYGVRGSSRFGACEWGARRTTEATSPAQKTPPRWSVAPGRPPMPTKRPDQCLTALDTAAIERMTGEGATGANKPRALVAGTQRRWSGSARGGWTRGREVCQPTGSPFNTNSRGTNGNPAH
jgi:hypothetical protein